MSIFPHMHPHSFCDIEFKALKIQSPRMYDSLYVKIEEILCFKKVKPIKYLEIFFLL